MSSKSMDCVVDLYHLSISTCLEVNNWVLAGLLSFSYLDYWMFVR